MSDKLAEFTGRLYAGIGRFVVEFEYMCQALRSTATLLFSSCGLQNEKLAQITLAGLTATPLLEVFVSLVSESVALNAEQATQLTEIRKRTDKLISERNRIIHSTWYLIDFADIEHGTPDGVVTNARRNRKGLDTQVSSYTRQELEVLSDEARAITLLVRSFTTALNLTIPVSVRATGFSGPA